jgi:proton glutamate symport protein
MIGKKKRKKIPLYLKIILGMILGLLWGVSAANNSWMPSFTFNYIQPFGEIFLNLLKMLAVPLIMSSLILGIANLRDLSKLARIGGRTMLLFLSTAFIATTLGLFIVNIVQPGNSISLETREKLMLAYKLKTEITLNKAVELKASPLKPLVDMVPDNIFGASTDNARMVQVVFFALIFGIALAKTSPEKGEPVIKFFDSINEILLKLVTIIMQFAPYGVFALMASLPGLDNLIYSLLMYMGTVLLGLLIMLLIVYPLIFTNFSKIKYRQFFKEMRPALLLAFTTSSSNATLPVTMERVEKHLGVSEDITGFVLPLGTTINMDGTALYQSIAAVFIAQVYGIDLSLLQMTTIVITATLAAAGAAGVPGAGMITLVIVLSAVGIPSEGIALIMAPDRILDMCRTVVNVSGDAVAAVVIANLEESVPDKNIENTSKQG